MFLVGLADSGGGCILVEVIVFLAEGDAALHHIEDVAGGVLLVGTDIGTEELVVAVGCHLELYLEEFVHRRGLLELFQPGKDGIDARLLTAGRVDREFVEVTEFTLYGSLAVVFLLQFLQDAVNTLVVLLAKQVEIAVAGVGGRQRMQLHPSAAGILKEIFSRIGLEVKVLQADARLIVLGGRCHGQGGKGTNG